MRVTQTGQDPAAQWSVGELHVFDGGRELARAPRWQPRAQPNPWDAAWAFDANPLTRWRSLEPLAAGMHFDVEFGGPIEVDAVALDCCQRSVDMQCSLEGREVTALEAAGSAPRRSETPPAADLRAAAVREIARRGITHVLLRDADFGADDFRDRTAEWGLRAGGRGGGLAVVRGEIAMAVDGRSHRHFGLALQSLARAVLSREVPGGEDARLLRAAISARSRSTTVSTACRRRRLSKTGANRRRAISASP